VENDSLWFYSISPDFFIRSLPFLFQQSIQHVYLIILLSVSVIIHF